MASFIISDTQRGRLKSTTQLAKLYIAFTPPFTLTATSKKASDFQYAEDFHWRPVPRMQGNRVAFVGEEITFYGGDSYLRGGGAAQGHTWDFGDGQSGSGTTVAHTYMSAGTREVKLTVDDGQGNSATGHRWCVVYADHDAAYDEVVEIRSLGGSLQKGGWSCDLKVLGDCTNIADRTGVVIYARDFWDTDSHGVGTEDTVGLYPERYDPHIVMCGYIVGNSIRIDPNTHDVTFQVKTAEHFLQNQMMYATDFWDSGQEGYGHKISGLTMADALQHILTEHTNFSTWHDVVLWQDDNQIFTCSLNEGTIWSWCQDMAQNEFGQSYCDKNSSLYIVPNINARGLDWWGSQDPPVMEFNTDNMFELEIAELPGDRVGFVEINANGSTPDQTPTGKYPDEPGASGQWEVIHGIMCDDEGFVNELAKRVFFWKNARYSGRLTTGLNHALDILQVFTLTYTSEQ